MKRLRVSIILSDTEYDFIKKLAKHDDKPVHEELTALLALQIWEEQQLYEQEYKEG